MHSDLVRLNNAQKPKTLAAWVSLTDHLEELTEKCPPSVIDDLMSMSLTWMLQNDGQVG